MQSDLDFLIVLLEQAGDSYVAQEDLDGPHGAALRLWQEIGFIGKDAVMNPVSGCPYCDEGTAYLLNGRYRCNACYSIVERQYLLLWPFHRKAFFRWLAGQLHLQGQVCQVDAALCHLGRWTSGNSVRESFYRLPHPLTSLGRARLGAYRHSLLLYGFSPPPEIDDPRTPALSLLSLLHPGTPFTVSGLADVLETNALVRFDSRSGEVWAGGTRLGAVPPGSREYAFFACLAAHLGEFVSYTDLKRYVQAQTGSIDATGAANFCHGLKSRIKRKCMPKIDLLLLPSNTGEGYRLPAVTEAFQK